LAFAKVEKRGRTIEGVVVILQLLSSPLFVGRGRKEGFHSKPELLPNFFDHSAARRSN